jgi:hypothetical protein
MSRSGGHAAGGVPSRFNISTTEGVADRMRMYGRVGSQVYHGRDLTETLPNTAPDRATAGSVGIGLRDPPPLLKVDRAMIAQRRVPPNRAVEAFDIVEDICRIAPAEALRGVRWVSVGVR